MPQTAKNAFGELERAVLDVLWNLSEDQWATVREVHEELQRDRDIAYTTVMTVLDRMSRKEVVKREKDGRAFRYRATGTRGAMTAELMHSALDEFDNVDRAKALLAFVGHATDAEREALRQALLQVD